MSPEGAVLSDFSDNATSVLPRPDWVLKVGWTHNCGPGESGAVHELRALVAYFQGRSHAFMVSHVDFPSIECLWSGKTRDGYMNRQVG